MINHNHRFLIADMNGFSHASATTKTCALKRARKLASETGLDMTVCYSERHRLTGTIHHVINVRCKDAAKLAKRHYATNGLAFISGENGGVR